MQIDDGLDTGDILLQREMEILPEDTSVSLAPRLAEMGAELLVETLAGSAEGRIQPNPQDNATRDPGADSEARRWTHRFLRAAQTICNRYRGFQPWPGAFTTFRGKQLTLHALSVYASANRPALGCGEIEMVGEQIVAGCGEGTAIAISELQLEGKRRMSAREFVNGYQPKAGERLGTLE